ncbi:MAG: FAD-dependent oxidoreductase [Clostridia bacterium]|nr:FAD-dependent oxidoreductase [Clostridia bacterium]
MKSVWETNAEFSSFSELDSDRRTQVLIIGGGITGILTAYCLKERGVDYILVEKNRICGGVTKNTTAKITFQHGLIYHKLLNKKGKEIAQGYLLSNKLAFEKLCHLCSNIDCDFEIKDNFIYSVYNRDVLEKEISALEKIGYSPLLATDLPLPFANVGAVCFPRQAQFNPLKLLSALSADLRIYENTFVRDIKGKTAFTDKCRIESDKIIVATHFPFMDKHGSYFMKLYQSRSYVIALENAPALNGMYLDEKDNGLSFRNYKDMLLIGGGDHRTGKGGGDWAELRSFAAMHYPEAKEKFHWATQDCMSLDGIPYIGNYSLFTPDVYVATGFNKWGMTGAMLSAMLLTDAVTDKKNDFDHIYSPSRNMLKPQLFVNGLETVSNLIGFPEKRCTHLGCALKWNKAEHTWDCPCHGSRFDKNGKVLDSPAERNLD